VTATDEDEFTELVDADFDRIDLVKAGANGVPRVLIAKQDGAAGLLDADDVRDLIAKAEPEAPGEQVTMTGSPAAIAALIHSASVAKAEMSSKSQNDLPDSAFAHIESGGKKDASGKTTPRSLRHYPVHDKAHAKNALGRAQAQINSGDADAKRIARAALPKIKSAAKKFGISVTKKEAGDDVAAGTVTKGDAGDMLDAQTDGGTDGLDPTVPLAAPEDDAPGDPTDPGSPAWEAIDAATAQKWCSILSRAEVALELLAEREMLEAASADPSDAENAFDLGDACCAIDYVISVLAPYAVAEQSEADCCGEDMLAAVGKAMAGAEEPLGAVEAFAAVMKAGRVLSSSNESLIRSAGESLQKVLASLPQAPLADDTVTKETAMAADTKPAGEPQDVAKETAQADAATEPETVAKDAETPAEPQEGVAKAGLQVAVYDKAGAVGLVDPARIGEQIAKADADSEGKPKMVAVFDSKGDLVGVCDPGDITPIAGADAPPANEEEPPAADKPAAEAPPADPADLTPAPAADAGTPADDVAKADASSDDEDPQAVLKSIVVTAVSEALGADPAKEEIAKQAGLIAAQSEEIEALKARLVTVENSPAAPKVFTNGATPPPGTLRGQDRAAPPVDVAKSLGRKQELYAASGPEQARIAKEMTEEAGAAYEAMRAAR
jgi:hypothetical protein